MRCHCHRAGGCCRAYDLAVLGKRAMNLHTHLEANAAIPIDRHVTTGMCLLRTHHFPDQATALRHQAREFGRARLAPDHRERDTIESVDLNDRKTS